MQRTETKPWNSLVNLIPGSLTRIISTSNTHLDRSKTCFGRHRIFLGDWSTRNYRMFSSVRQCNRWAMLTKRIIRTFVRRWTICRSVEMWIEQESSVIRFLSASLCHRCREVREEQEQIVTNLQKRLVHVSNLVQQMNHFDDVQSLNHSYDVRRYSSSSSFCSPPLRLGSEHDPCPTYCRSLLTLKINDTSPHSSQCNHAWHRSLNECELLVSSLDLRLLLRQCEQ